MPEAHEGLPVAGYQAQSQSNVDRVNENKHTEERLLRLMETCTSNMADPRWMAIAKTHFEQGFMAFNRAIFRPKRVTLPEDKADPREDKPRD